MDPNDKHRAPREGHLQVTLFFCNHNLFLGWATGLDGSLIHRLLSFESSTKGDRSNTSQLFSRCRCIISISDKNLVESSIVLQHRLNALREGSHGGFEFFSKYGCILSSNEARHSSIFRASKHKDTMRHDSRSLKHQGIVQRERALSEHDCLSTNRSNGILNELDSDVGRCRTTKTVMLGQNARNICILGQSGLQKSRNVDIMNASKTTDGTKEICRGSTRSSECEDDARSGGGSDGERRGAHVAGVRGDDDGLVRVGLGGEGVGEGSVKSDANIVFRLVDDGRGRIGLVGVVSKEPLRQPANGVVALRLQTTQLGEALGEGGLQGCASARGVMEQSIDIRGGKGGVVGDLREESAREAERVGGVCGSFEGVGCTKLGKGE